MAMVHGLRIIDSNGETGQIDPCHCWEIADGNIKVKDVNKIFLDCGFKIKKFKELYYVDYWILKKI